MELFSVRRPLVRSVWSAAVLRAVQRFAVRAEGRRLGRGRHRDGVALVHHRRTLGLGCYRRLVGRAAVFFLQKRQKHEAESQGLNWCVFVLMLGTRPLKIRAWLSRVLNEVKKQQHGTNLINWSLVIGCHKSYIFDNGL